MLEYRLIMGWVLGLLPAIIVIQHAIYLRLSRKRFQGTDTGLNDRMAFLRPAWQLARTQDDIDFSYFGLLARYGVPAILVAGITIMWVSILPEGAMQADVQSMTTAGTLGLIGAYAYTLLTLGQRYFRRDITSGIVVWCAVTLAFGPLLAGTVYYLWNGPKTSTPVSSGVVYFLAGMAPQYVTAFLAEAARRLLQATDGANVTVPRTVPLIQVRGITQSIADRLGEEGLADVCGLAMASPSRLLRNTSFDPRMTLAWIDEALLITTLPGHWQKLEDNGISGAIDLVWYHLEPPAGANAANPPPTVPPGAPPAQERPNLQTLASQSGIDPVILRDVVDRMFEDAQVQLVWVLYQKDSEETH
jgi:hypothetical protein